MPEQLEHFLANWAYVVWAFGAASVFYGATKFATSHLHEDKKAQLSLWLQGDYESTWSAQFCAMFDGIFGEKHWHLRCILLSAVTSVMAVLGLWLLLDHILGLISLRADTGLSLTQALLLGAAINIIPDYLSLFETRWLLQRFERIRNPFLQLLVLIGDALLTGLIIYLGIQAYLWVTGQAPIAVVEMVALFSFYAIFFYSTFLTSIWAWAWAYCLSSWVARLGRWVDAKNNPGRSLALIGGVFVFLGTLATYPVVKMDEDGRIALDDLLCETFPASACIHVARLTKDEQQKLEYLSKACIGGVHNDCDRTAWFLKDVAPSEALIVWTKSCGLDHAQACTNLGFMYSSGFGVEQDFERALKHYSDGCDGGHARGCTNLGVLYERGLGTAQNLPRAVRFYKKGCDGGHSGGCANFDGVFSQERGTVRHDNF